MNEEYLWDRTGEPDPEIVRLEKLLGPLRHSGEAVPPRQPRPHKSPRKSAIAWWLAAAAVLAAAIPAVPLLFRGPLTSWRLPDGRCIRAGQTIVTGASQPAKIHSSDTGEVTIDPGSLLRLLASTAREQRFDLRRGAIHAFIWAPPGRFVVDTPSSKTIDLGCRYTLRVLNNGTGLLTVELGWVAFERDKIESFIPAGAACVTRPDREPGTPYFTDASPALINALSSFDSSRDPAALASAIAASRRRDALSLWHLMIRTHGAQRAQVYDRFASLVTLPPQITRQAILDGDDKAMDAAWNALDLGKTDWWRQWKSRW